MFTVDLLKGQGIPLKTRPAGIAILAAGVAVPFIIAVIMIGIYINNRVVIPIKEHEIAVYDQKMQTLSEAVKAQQMFYKEKDSINKSVPELAVAVSKFNSWSPVIRVIAENMPGNMVLSNLEGKQSFVKAKETTRTDMLFAKREAGINISGNAKGNCDEEVKGFRSRLLGSNTLKSRIQDIPVSQQSNSSGGEKDTVSYEMRIIFKDGM